MSSTTARPLAVAAAVLALGVATTAAGAGALVRPGVTRAAATACRGDSVKPAVHDQATRREATLAALVAALQRRKDPFGLNGAQVGALQDANRGITALDAQIASTCYPTLAAFRSDADRLFVGYRVYWLRSPQTHVIEAADWLAEARAHLASAAAKLAPLVGSNASAQADYDAMTQALAAADAKLGIAPDAGPSIATTAGLQPAADMSHDAAVLNAAHTDLLAVRASLVEARADGLEVVRDLHG